MRPVALALAAALAAAPAFAQQRPEKVVFAPGKDAKLEEIRKEVRKPAEAPPANRMWVDFSTVDRPAALTEFTSVWHQPPVCQGLSGMCWCFATTSMFESEVYRLTKREMRFSVLHSVYWEYIEKARGFVRSRGTSFLGEGSQAAAVLRAWRDHGAVPAEAYTGLEDGARHHDHQASLFREIKTYLDGVKAAGAWNEEAVASTVASILDSHLGKPPATINVGGKTLAPKQYLDDVVRIDPDDYVAFVSVLDKPAWQHVEFEVPDNWWHDTSYLNLPLDVFMATFKDALRKGFSLVVSVDMSEPGYSIGPPGIAVVPSWDIPASHIDENARHFRFAAGITTDDHAMHVVGYTERNGKDWYLVKDSWSSSWNNDHPGYYFFHEDYVKLKVLAFVVHKDAVAGVLEKARRSQLPADTTPE